MIKNYIKTALRNISKNRISSFINISGLALGITSFIIIGVYVYNELSFDEYHSKSERIFRAGLSLNLNGITYNEASLQFPASKIFADEYPEVKASVRIYKDQEFTLIKYGDKKFTEEKFFFADPNIFQVFDITNLKGDPVNALSDPNAIIISESTAQKYFGDSDPIGKILNYENQSDFKVAGVFRDIPINSHFHFDFLASLDYMIDYWNNTIGADGRHNNWYWNGAWTYLLFNSKEAADNFTGSMPRFVKKYFPDRYQKGSIFLQPLTSIHLHSDLGNEIEANGNITEVYIFSTIAIFILFIACINFINLSIAQGSDRAKEIGVRKVLGAGKHELIAQIIGETIVSGMLAAAVSLILAELVLPYAQVIFGRELSLSTFNSFDKIFLLLILSTVVGVVSGIFPALYLSNLNPVKILKKTIRLNFSYEILRKGLVVLQFSVSIFLIIGMGMIFKQMNYIKNKDLGFDKESVLVIKGRPEINDKFDSFRNEILNTAGIMSITGTSDVPGRGSNGSRFVPEDGLKNRPLMLPLTYVDYDFLTTMKIKLKKGRDFSRLYSTDKTTGFILNRQAAKNLGWENDPVGKKLELFGPGTDEIVKSGKVIGVIEDYNYESLHSDVKPLVLTFNSNRWYYLIRMEKGNISERLAAVENIWNRFSPDWPFESFFLDKSMERLYQSDQRLSTIVNLFGILAVIIACLGLYGLASFAAKKRIKEIGIRKVLGASVPGIVKLLSSDFIKLVAVANIIAFPAAFYLIKNWLEEFAYRVNVDLLIFLYAAGITIVIALLTVIVQSVRAAFSNPVETLKYE